MADIFDTLAANSSTQTLVKAIEKSGMAEMMKGSGIYTLFAPNDEAFSRMNTESMLNDVELLRSTLRYHLVPGNFMFDEIKKIETLPTENGKSLTIALEEGEVVVDNAKFIRTDIECSNGIIHIIDNVFQPQLSGWYREE